MYILFSIISLLLFAAIIVGLIRPQLVIHWGEKRGRLRVLLYYIPALLVSFLLIGVTAPPPTPAELAAQQAADQKKAEQKAAAQKAADEKAADEKAAAQKAAAQKAAAQKAAAQKAAAQKAAAQKAAAQKAADEKAAAQQAEASYKASAQMVNWLSLSRNPGQFTGKVLWFKGQVISILPDTWDSGEQIQIAVQDGNGVYSSDQYVEVHWFPAQSNQNRILENDIIEAYGSFTGIQEYTLTSGQKVGIPELEAKYIDLYGHVNN